MRNVIFIAPPAAGKGTISDYLIKHLGYKHLSVGDLLRKEVSLNTPLGQELDEIMKSGKLVSDDIAVKLVSQELAKISNSPFIIDGFPRVLSQALKLDEMLVSNNITNNCLIYLDISLDEALKRVLNRVICPKCQRSYSLNNDLFKPKTEGICDDCHTALTTRKDDNADSFKKRFATYLENTIPVLEHYRSQSNFYELDATLSSEELIKEVLKIIKSEADQ